MAHKTALGTYQFGPDLRTGFYTECSCGWYCYTGEQREAAREAGRAHELEHR